MNSLLRYLHFSKAGSRVLSYLGLASGSGPPETSYEYVPELNPDHAASDLKCIAFFQPAPKGSGAGPNAGNHDRADPQIALNYGVHGFCVDVQSSRVERDQVQFQLQALPSGRKDVPFCICWSDSIQLIHDAPEERSQTGSARGLLYVDQFVDFVARFVREPHYIRIGEFPLLLFRLPVLSDPGAAAARIRKRLVELGIHEPFLVAVGPGGVNPTDLGFDATVDLAPRTASAQAGDNDYRERVRQSYDICWPGYPRFHAVSIGHSSCVGDTDEPLTSSPAAYQEWLENCCRDTRAHFGSDARLVFIDCWSGSTERTSLKPDSRFGCGYLNATRKALETLDLSSSPPAKVAVIAHVFYEDIWREIATYLRQWKMPFRVYVTVPQERADAISKVVLAEYPQARISAFPNRGRDILPFLEQAGSVLADGVELICKVHSKKTPHREDGDRWREEVYRALLGSANAPHAILDAFRRNAAIGIIAAEGHVIPLERYWGANKRKVRRLAAGMKYTGDLSSLLFVAGSMFWIRARALEPLLRLSLSKDDFEEERAQADGTMAHAVERAFPIAAKAAGFRLVDTRVLGSVDGQLRSDRELIVANQPIKTYRFAPLPPSA